MKVYPAQNWKLATSSAYLRRLAFYYMLDKRSSTSWNSISWRSRFLSAISVWAVVQISRTLRSHQSLLVPVLLSKQYFSEQAPKTNFKCLQLIPVLLLFNRTFFKSHICSQALRHMQRGTLIVCASTHLLISPFSLSSGPSSSCSNLSKQVVRRVRAGLLHWRILYLLIVEISQNCY